MAKQSKKLLLVILAFVLAFSVIACVACNETTYDLTYAAGDGTGTAPETELYAEGAPITVKANMFTAPTGKEFDGWSDGTTTYQANATFTMPANAVTLTAQWKTKIEPQPEVWTVTFKNGTETVKTVQVTKGQKLTTEQIPAAPAVGADKEFKGWFDNETEITVDTVISSNITAMAKIENKTLTEKVAITYKAGEGTGEDVVVYKSKGLAFNLAAESEIGTAFIAPQGMMLVGWKLQGDASSKVYAFDEEYSASAASTFVAQWAPAQVLQNDTNATASLLLSLKDNTGKLCISNEVGSDTEVELTYALTDTALTITIAETSYTGTWGNDGIAITLVYQSKNYVFQPKQIATDAPAVTFNANGGAGNDPTVEPIWNENAQKYKITLPPKTTYTPPAGKEFNAWEVAENSSVLGTYASGFVFVEAGSTVVIKAIWQDSAVEPGPIEGVTFTGRCTVPTTVVGGVSVGGQTYVKIVVDLEGLRIEYALSDNTTAQVAITDVYNDRNTSYGTGAKYLKVKMADGLSYYLLLDAGQTKLTICNTSYTVLTNGEFIVEQGEEPPVNDKTIEDYLGAWGGELVVSGTIYVGIIIENESFTLISSEGDEMEYGYEDSTIKTVAGKLVVEYATMMATWTLTFTSDGALNVKYVKTFGSAITATADFAPIQFVTVTYSLGQGVEGIAPEAQQVIPGVLISAPRTNPTRFGYIFLGWYAPDAATVFNFAETPIAESVTLTAHWQQIENVAVTFMVKNGNPNYGGENIVQNIPFNTAVEKPSDLECEGYYFLGWFTTSAATIEYDFTANVTDNTTIYAGWEKKLTLTTVIPGQENITQSVRTNDTITLGEAPDYFEGYTFAGWTINDGATLNEAGAEYKITGTLDVTITAVFTTPLTNGNDETEKLLTLRTDNKVIYCDEVYPINLQGVATISGEAYYIDSEARQYWLLDGMQGLTLVTTSGSVQLVLNGRGGATIDGKDISYTFSNNTLTVTDDNGGHEVTLGIGNDGYVVVSVLTLTVNGTEYTFGPSSEEPDPDEFNDSVKTYVGDGTLSIGGRTVNQIVIDLETSTITILYTNAFNKDKTAIYENCSFDANQNGYRVTDTNIINGILESATWITIAINGSYIAVQEDDEGVPGDILGTLTLVEE